MRTLKCFPGLQLLGRQLSMLAHCKRVDRTGFRWSFLAEEALRALGAFPAGKGLHASEPSLCSSSHMVNASPSFQVGMGPPHVALRPCQAVPGYPCQHRLQSLTRMMLPSQHTPPGDHRRTLLTFEHAARAFESHACSASWHGPGHSSPARPQFSRRELGACALASEHISEMHTQATPGAPAWQDGSSGLVDGGGGPRTANAGERRRGGKKERKKRALDAELERVGIEPGPPGPSAQALQGISDGSASGSWDEEDRSRPAAAMMGVYESTGPHVPVMLQEILGFFRDCQLTTFLDGTLGAGAR